MAETERLTIINALQTLKLYLTSEEQINTIVEDKSFQKCVDAIRVNTPRARLDADICQIYSKFFSNNDAVDFYERFFRFILDGSSEFLSVLNTTLISYFFRYNCIMWNVTDVSIDVCTKMLSNKTFSLLFKFLSLREIYNENQEDSIRIKMVHTCLGILQNILNNTNTLVRSDYREHVEMLFKYANENSVKAKLTATASFMLLIFLLNDKEFDRFDFFEEKIKEILLYLEDSLYPDDRYSNFYGYHTEEVLVALKHLAGSERNKKLMLENNVLMRIKSGLVRALQLGIRENYKSEKTNKFAELNLELLWSLSFAQKTLELNKTFREFYGILNQFNVSSWPNSCRQQAQGILWNIGPQDKLNVIAQEQFRYKKDGHVMISYNHRTQDIMLKVKRGLEAKGYKVWMDVDYRKDSFVDAMAEGIYGASIIILGLCQAFKTSPHCQQEVRLAYSKKIPLLPIHLEKDFNTEGWLDLVLATILYIPLYDESMVDDALTRIAERLEARGELDGFVQTTDENQVVYWSNGEVVKWLEENNLIELEEKFSGITGSHLNQMLRMNQKALESLCAYLRAELCLSFIQTLTLLSALSKLS